MELSVVRGTTTVPIRHLLEMGRGAVIELDTTAEEPASIYANGKFVARGEVMVEDHIGITLTGTVSAYAD